MNEQPQLYEQAPCICNTHKVACVFCHGSGFVYRPYVLPEPPEHEHQWVAPVMSEGYTPGRWGLAKSSGFSVYFTEVFCAVTGCTAKGGE